MGKRKNSNDGSNNHNGVGLSASRSSSPRHKREGARAIASANAGAKASVRFSTSAPLKTKKKGTTSKRGTPPWLTVPSRSKISDAVAQRKNSPSKKKSKQQKVESIIHRKKKKSVPPPSPSIAQPAGINTNKNGRFQEIQLPPKRAAQGRIPWLANLPKKPVDAITKSSDLSSKKRSRLPTDDSDPVRLARFSQELLAFADYIRLSPAECAAREALLEHMHQVAVRVFQNTPDINVSDIDLQVFGSYACKEVCSYRSDVDVALWGVVFPKLTHVKKQVRTAVNVKQELNEKQLSVDPKTQRKQKWITALDRLDELNLMSPDLHDSDQDLESAKGFSSNSSDKGDGREKPVEEPADDAPLFVLDRTGIELPIEGDDAKKEAVDGNTRKVAAASISTQGTVTESESSSDNRVVVVREGNENGEDDVEEDGEDDDDEEWAPSESDEDTADKMTEHHCSASTAASIKPQQSSTAKAIVSEQRQTPPQTADDDDDDDESHLVIHFFNEDKRDQTDASDFSRRKVVDALQRFFRGLRNSGLSKSIQLISKARVPIIKMQALLGVEIDCSIGGMNGADTRLYARKMSEMYKSFAPVVLALKVIMGQQNLDTPFSGGLGSYKLYVLVASHITKHVELGGNDDPGEIFMSFVFRYGDSVGHHQTHRATRTYIEKGKVVSCSYGGQADLSNVFLINECRSLFGSVWKRLWGLLRQTGQFTPTDSPQTSYLAEVLHTTWLDHNRQTNIRNAELFMKEREKIMPKGPSRTIPRALGVCNVDTTTMSAARRKRDLTEDELIASYQGTSSKKSKISL